MLSIIIPVWQEREHLPSLLHYLTTCPDLIPHAEIIVVSCEGDCRYDLPEINPLVVRLVHCPNKGRAAQLNYGVATARGEVLYFLHADTFPPANFQNQIMDAKQAGYDCGSFYIHFDEPHFLLQFFSSFFRWDVPLMRFGDQSLFVSKELFGEIGGFREDHLVMEDQEIAWRLYRTGRFRLIPVPVLSSGRKFRKNGTIRLLMIFSLLYVMYYFRFPQKMLVKMYSALIRGSNI